MPCLTAGRSSPACAQATRRTNASSRNPRSSMPSGGDLVVWAKDLADGSKAVGLFNRGEQDADIAARWSDLSIQGRQVVRDLWRQQDVGRFDNVFTAKVGRHGATRGNLTPS